MKLPKALQGVIEGFEQLPGIGPKSAQRLAFHLMRLPEDEVNAFAKAIFDLKSKTLICKNCYNVSEDELCQICSDNKREVSLICVVESPLDLLAIEKSKYNGVYHVLHGVINPMAGIGPDEIFIKQLEERLANEKFEEVILATSTSLEGEATAMYIKTRLNELYPNVKISRIGRGLPIGADIEYADENTLRDALNGRVNY